MAYSEQFLASFVKSLKSLARSVISHVPTLPYLYLRNCLRFRKVAHPWRPRSFNDHMLRMMLDARDSRRRIFADKLETRAYVESRIGSGYLPKIYVQTDDVDKIDLSSLPDSFVLKTSHGCGMNQIVLDKSQIDIESVKMRLRKWMATDYGKLKHEWVYAGISPRLFAEELLEMAPGKVPYDYKFFCFHGCVRLIQVVQDRSLTNFSRRTHAFYDPDWQRLEMSWGAPQAKNVSKPPLLAKMTNLARILSTDFNFLRVDMYVLGDRIVLGELTNFPDAGAVPIKPTSRDDWLGSFFQTGS